MSDGHFLPKRQILRQDHARATPGRIQSITLFFKTDVLEPVCDRYATAVGIIVDPKPVAPMVQLVTSKPSDVGT